MVLTFFPKSYKLYVEPFVGTGTVFFSIDKPQCCEVINDIDERVAKLYSTSKDARLSGVIVKNMDYKTILRDYDSDDTFFYIEPPQFDVFLINAEELRLGLRELKGKFLLNYMDSPNVRRLFSGFRMTSDKGRVLITNY